MANTTPTPTAAEHVTGEIAVDIDLLRHPAPRRYITTLEALRNRRITILPFVNVRLAKCIVVDSADTAEARASEQGTTDPEVLDKAKVV